MNNYFNYLLIPFVLLSFALGQVTEKMVEFKFGEHNALVITLPDVDKNLVEDEWKGANKSFGKTDKKKGEFINTNINLNGLTNPVDWYMVLDKKKGDIELALCVISNEEFLSSSNQPSNFAVVNKFITDFAYTVEVAKVREKYESEKKDLEKLQKDLEKTNKNIDDNNDTIKKHGKKLDKYNDDIKSNVKEQNKLSESITTQGAVVNGLLIDGALPVEDSAEYEAFNKENEKLQKLQDKLEKLKKDYEGLQKDIEKSTKKIEKAQKDNKSESNEVDKLKKKISKQGNEVESLRKKLESM